MNEAQYIRYALAAACIVGAVVMGVIRRKEDDYIFFLLAGVAIAIW